MTPNLHEYSVILVNSSGGKDSQTMLDYIVKMADSQGLSRARIVVAHADLGRVEWKGTRDLAYRQAKHYGLRFEAVARAQDLLDQIEQRGKFPDSQNRYCTSDHKRDQISKIITKLNREVQVLTTLQREAHVPHFKVLNCLGLRAQESPARAKKEPLVINKRQSNGKRTVTDWLPILDWSEKEVWASIKESGVEYHPAYDLGMPRLSCIFCIFAPKAALVLAGRANPELLDEYVRVEKKINFTFRQDVSMADVKAAVESGEAVGAMSGKWNM